MRKFIVTIACTALALGLQAGSVKENGVTLAAKSTAWSKDNGSYNTAPQGKKFVFVDVEVSNASDKSIHCNPVCFQLVDREGKVYSSTWCSKEGLDAVNLLHGQKATGKVAFEVPYNATAAELVFEVSYKQVLRLRL